MEGRDVYEYLTNFASDEDILNMLSVNKKFDDPKFFQRILQKRYPFLLKYKTDNISWRRFYVAMIYWISKMRETFPDVSTDMFDPELVKESERMNNQAKLFAYRTKILNFIEMFYGIDDLVFLKQPLIDFIKNMDFGDNANLKEFLLPILKIGVLNRSLLTKIFMIYLSQNNRIIDGKKYYFIAPNMQHYIEDYLTQLEESDRAKSDSEMTDSRGNIRARFDRNQFVFNRIQQIASQGVVESNELTNEQKKILYMSALKKIF